jgi:hypothetical protein
MQHAGRNPSKEFMLVTIYSLLYSVIEQQFVLLQVAHLHRLAHYLSGFILEMGTCYLRKMKKMNLLRVIAKKGKIFVRWFYMTQ